jgi:hypothetical protein
MAGIPVGLLKGNPVNLRLEIEMDSPQWKSFPTR